MLHAKLNASFCTGLQKIDLEATGRSYRQTDFNTREGKPFQCLQLLNSEMEYFPC